MTPQCQPGGSEEHETWLKATIEANPACQPEGSEEYEAWRKKKLEGHQKILTKRMAEPLSDTVVAAQQAEAKRMAPTKSVAVLPKVLLRWMPSRLSPLVAAAVSAAAAAAADDDDDGDGGGGDDDDDDDNDNDDNYDDDDDAFLGLVHYTCSTRPPVNGKNFDRRLLSTILDSGTRPYMP